MDKVLYFGIVNVLACGSLWVKSIFQDKIALQAEENIRRLETLTGDARLLRFADTETIASLVGMLNTCVNRNNRKFFIRAVEAAAAVCHIYSFTLTEGETITSEDYINARGQSRICSENLHAVYSVLSRGKPEFVTGRDLRHSIDTGLFSLVQSIKLAVRDSSKSPSKNRA